MVGEMLSYILGSWQNAGVWLVQHWTMVNWQNMCANVLLRLVNNVGVWLGECSIMAVAISGYSWLSVW